MSVVAHAVLIGGWVLATLPATSLPRESFANRVYYLPPPDRPMIPLGRNETVRYVTAAPGIGAGPGPTVVEATHPVVATEHSPTAGPQKVDTVAATLPPVIGEKTGDSVFTILEVDTAVVRSQTSAAPAYPLELLAKHVEGTVVARYVVDTTGFADSASFEVVRATNDGFIRAVRAALPYMRFSPAKIGSMKVRQLVEQPFTFRITPNMAAAPKP